MGSYEGNWFVREPFSKQLLRARAGAPPRDLETDLVPKPSSVRKSRCTEAGYRRKSLPRRIAFSILHCTFYTLTCMHLLVGLLTFLPGTRLNSLLCPPYLEQCLEELGLVKWLHYL